MQQIALFLEQFNNIGLDNMLLKEAVIEGVQTHLGIKLDKSQVTLKQNNIYITIPPAGKSELFMKRAAIADFVVARCGKKKAPKFM